MAVTDLSIHPPGIKRHIDERQYVKNTGWRARLHQRGITDAAIDRAGIRADGHGWLYPVAPGLTVRRWKAWPGQRGPKYAWKPSKPEQVRFYDPAGDLAEHIAAAGGVLILASGEPDVWACWSAGIFNVTCTMMGEGTIPPWLIEQLHALGVQTVQAWPDCDRAGLNHVRKVNAALQGSGIGFEAYALPYADDSKADLNYLLITYSSLIDVKAGHAGFRAALDSCPPAQLPAPEDRPTAEPPRRFDPPADYADLYERWCVEVVEAAAVRLWQISPPNGKGFSRKPVRCVFHDDQKPSANWNYNTHGLHCHRCAQTFSTAAVAERLSVQTWPDYKADHAPHMVGAKAAYQTLSDAPITATRFPFGFPFTVRKRLLNAHYRLKGQVKAQRPADLVLEVWQELRDVWPDDMPITPKQFEIAAAHIGRNVTEHTAQTGLAMLAAWGMTEIRENCNLPTREHTNRQVANFPNLPTCTRPATYYQFLPWDRQLENFARHYAYLERESAFAGVPSDVQAEYGDLDGDDLRLLDDYRAPVYATHEAARQKSQDRLDQRMGRLEGDIERIQQGRYRAVTLPPGPIPNAAALMRALHKADLTAAGGEREKAYLAQFDLGVSRSTLSRIRTVNAAITVTRERVIPLADVTDYQRAAGLVLSENEETATVRAPSAEKFVDMADEHERAAYEALCQRQRENRAKAKAHESQFESTERPPVPITIPAAYSDRHVIEQFEFTPGADAIPRYDGETGEVYTPAQLWRALAESVRKGAAMPTFTAHSEPSEHEIEGTDIPRVTESHQDRPIGDPSEPRDHPTGAPEMLKNVETAPRARARVKPVHPSGFWPSLEYLAVVMGTDESEAAR